MQASREGAKHDEERRALTLSPLSGTESETYYYDVTCILLTNVGHRVMSCVSVFCGLQGHVVISA